MELLGILVGHVYFFLKYKYPLEHGGPDLLATPQWLCVSSRPPRPPARASLFFPPPPCPSHLSDPPPQPFGTGQLLVVCVAGSGSSRTVLAGQVASAAASATTAPPPRPLVRPFRVAATGLATTERSGAPGDIPFDMAARFPHRNCTWCMTCSVSCASSCRLSPRGAGSNAIVCYPR